MEKPNYRLGYVDAAEFTGRVVSSATLRNITGGIAERTFCLFHDSCRCESVCRDHCETMDPAVDRCDCDDYGVCSGHNCLRD